MCLELMPSKKLKTFDEYMEVARKAYQAQDKFKTLNEFVFSQAEITPISTTSFALTFGFIPESVFARELNFGPIMEEFDLNPKKQEFLLNHWNVSASSMNYKLGIFGFFQAYKGKTSYKLINHKKILESAINVRPLQIEKAVLPSAVLLYNNAHLVKEGRFFRIENI